MLEQMTSLLSSSMPRTIIITIFMVLFAQFNIYRHDSVKVHVFGVVFSLLTSVSMLTICQVVTYVLITSLLLSWFNLSSLALLTVGYLVYVFIAYIFSLLYVQTIRYHNKHSDDYIVPYWGYFMFSQYVIILYITYIFSDNLLQVYILSVVFTVAWYICFQKDLGDMKKIYPEVAFSAENMCLVVEVLVIAMLWFLPSVFSSDSTVSANSNFWLKALSILQYIFCILIYKVIFHQSMHSHNEYLAHNRDALTGLFSRNYFIEQGEVVLERAYSLNENMAVMYLNINHFRYVNQNYGSGKGNELLINLGKALSENFSGNTIISRLSDDHFAILTDELENTELKLIKARIMAMSSTAISRLQLNAGIYITDHNKVTIATALEFAAIASGVAKSNNTVSFSYYDDALKDDISIRAYVLENIDRAINEGMIKVYYQPIVDVVTEKIVSAEALARWEDDKLGFLPPGKFVPVLEDQNLIYKIDGYIIEQVCKDHKRLLDEGKKVFPVSFNISRKDFFITDMVDFVESMVEKYSISKDLIKIEITESALTSNDYYLREQIERFIKLGYKVWMDDFGSGYSSLNDVGSIPFSGIKLDLVFLRDLTKQKEALINGIIKTAKKFGLEVLTEGVETSKQLELLRECGCDYAQGYKFSRPLPLEAHLNNPNINI